MTSYLWSGPEDNGATTRCINMGTAGEYTVIITDANGCKDTCSRTLTVDPQPVCEITGDSVVCYGFTTEFCATLGMASYAWTGPGGFNANTRCTGQIGVEGYYEVIITDANDCADTCGRNLVVNDQPVCDITGGKDTLCVGDSTEWCATAGMSAYLWTGSGGFSRTTQCVYVGAGLTAGTYTYQVIITDANGCADTCSRDLTVQVCGQEHCGLTQGAYGTAGGYEYFGMGTLQLIQFLIDGTPLVVGKPGRSLTIPLAAAECIILRLEANGPPTALPATLGDATLDSLTCQTSPIIPLQPNSPQFRNVLLGQTIALSLNVRLACDLGTFEPCIEFETQAAMLGPDGIPCPNDDVVNPGPEGINGTWDDPVAIFIIPQSVLTALSNLGLANTVNGLLELANRALAGQPRGGASFGDINKAVDAINRGFDKCRFVTYCGPVRPITLSKEAQSPEEEAAVASVPTEFSVSQNHPNPFNPECVIAYALPIDCQVTLKIYNILGQKVKVLVDEYQNAGYKSAKWDGKDDQGREVASGIYFYRLQA
jgi:hypothetical protein